MNTGGRSGREGEALTAPTSREARRVRAVRELNDPLGDEGAAGWNMTSGVVCFAKDQGHRGARAILEARCQATVVEQRKGCTDGQSAEAERQRQEGQQKPTARAAAKAGMSWTERMQRRDKGARHTRSAKERRRKQWKKSARGEKENEMLKRNVRPKQCATQPTCRHGKKKDERE